MGYERNDRRYGSSDDRGYGGYGADRGRGDYQGGGQRTSREGRFDDRSGGGYGRQPQGYDYQDRDRGFFERAGDEVRSWFGDDDAERRRRDDERGDRRYRDDYPGADYYSGSSGVGVSDRGYDRSYGGGSGYEQQRGQSRFGQGQGQGGNDQGRHHDASYSSWRDRQMQSFDRDYDEYRREHQSKFDNEFHSWRQGRQGQRDLLNQVEEHHEVVGSDGQHVGTVDHVRGDQIELTRSDKDAGGKHHFIPSSWLQSVEGGKVTLNKTAAQAKQQWRDDQRSEGGLFGKRDENEGANRGTLNRSFSGTY